MRKPINAVLTLLLLLFTSTIAAQVTFVLNSLPANTPEGARFYIAGSFNNWNPNDPTFEVKPNNLGKPEITLEAGNSTIQFKFTRGSWESCEGSSTGGQIANRTFTYGNGQTVQISIAGWEDNGSGTGGSTAASNVHIISESFEIPQLNRTRRIWIYLPPDYATSEKNYPVLYMHDGQNIFDEKTSYAGEWAVDETLNSLYSQDYTVPIVVAIDNGGTYRINELSPWVNPNYGGGDGELYMAFLTETLKPYIDSHYRTLTNAANTGLMGSSLGGFITHYALCHDAQMFGKFGIFSPAYWFSDSVTSYTTAMFQPNGRIYLMAGDNEGAGVVPDMESMAALLLSKGQSFDDLYSKVVPGGQHNESLWKNEFEEAVIWLFRLAPGIDEKKTKNTGYWYPNPCKEELHFAPGKREIFPEEVSLFTANGETIRKLSVKNSQSFDVSTLVSGLYIMQSRYDDYSEWQTIMVQ